MLKITGSQLSDWDIKKVIKMLRRDISISGFEGREQDRETLFDETGVFRFIKQLLVERPSYVHCIVDALLQSNIITGKYVKHHNLHDENISNTDLDCLIGYIVKCASEYNRSLIPPEGTLLN